MTDQVDLKPLALAVLEHAARDAKKGDPVTAAWFLTQDAKIYADVADLDDGFIGQMAYRFMEVFYHGS